MWTKAFPLLACVFLMTQQIPFADLVAATTRQFSYTVRRFESAEQVWSVRVFSLKKIKIKDCLNFLALHKGKLPKEV